MNLAKRTQPSTSRFAPMHGDGATSSRMHPAPSPRTSWLSLVAETAGVAGAGITRVFVTCPEFSSSSGTVFVQVVDHDGNLVGAARQTAPGFELRTGMSIDLGLYLDLACAASVCAWVEEGTPPGGPRQVVAPVRAKRTHYDPFSTIQLTLSAPTSSAEDDLAA